MCEGICTVPLKYFLHLLPLVVDLNFERLHMFWKTLSVYVSLEQIYVLKAACFSEIVALVYLKEAPDQDSVSVVVGDSLRLLDWQP